MSGTNSFLTSLFLPANLMAPRVPMLPTPVTTSNFPDHGADNVHPNSGRRRRKRARRQDVLDCSICLEPLHHEVATLPCKHQLHRRCLFSLTTYPVLGARSMVHCPMCRYALDRYDLRDALGCEVSVSRMKHTADRCGYLRTLTNGTCSATAAALSQATTTMVANLVAGCQSMTADDGFVYNVAVLAIDRAISHRQNFVTSLRMQLECPRNRTLDTMEFIAGNLSCHIEVLMRTASTAVDNT